MTKPLITTNRHIILASQSIARQALLKQAGVSFDIVPSMVDEEGLKDQFQSIKISALVTLLANEKAKDVSNRYLDAIVIGADQCCVMNGKLYNKPGSVDIAIQHLTELSGQRHQLLTGVSICIGGVEVWSMCDESSMTMRALTNDEIKAYIRIDSPLQSCGAYNFESFGRHLFDDAESSGDVIQGLPLLPLLKALRELNAYNIV